MHLRHVLLWHFNKDNDVKGDVLVEEIQKVYGKDSIKRAAVFKWLKRFKEGNKDLDDLEDEPRSGRPSNFDEDMLQRLVEEDPKITIRELSAILKKSVSTVHSYLHSLGFVSFVKNHIFQMF